MSGTGSARPATVNAGRVVGVERLGESRDVVGFEVVGAAPVS